MRVHTRSRHHTLTSIDVHTASSFIRSTQQFELSLSGTYADAAASSLVATDNSQSPCTTAHEEE
jgi:hypothetical protein